MQIDRIKISQEVNFLGMPTWIGMEASLLPDDNEKEGLKTLQKSITEYVSANNKQGKALQEAPYNKEVTAEAQAAADKEIEKVFNKVKAKLSKYPNQEEAQAYLDTTDFRYNIEAKNIIQSLPKK